MLTTLAFIYGKIVDLRNYLYDRGVLDAFDLGARTISIGNITAGGTGKTPLVAYVASILAERGERVCILTRGYGRENENRRVLVSDGEQLLGDFREAGDEPVELAQKLLGKAIVIADADRVSAAEWAIRKFGVTAFVLDDAFQHRRAKRDLDIVCIDATDPFGGGEMLPAGRLREPVANLRRADAVVITRSDVAKDISNLKFQISNLVEAECPVFAAENEIGAIVSLKRSHVKTPGTQRAEKAELTSKKCFAFCGIGRPENFFEMLRRNGISVAGSRAFSDHNIYMQRDIQDVEERAHDAGAEILLTTAKDAVKLVDLKFDMPCYVVEITTSVDDPIAFAATL